MLFRSRKKPMPRVDINALRPGTFVLNDKAASALKRFLSDFGQLLEIDVDGSREWLYNVTNVVDCIDDEKSTKRSTGVIAKEVFVDDRVPAAAAVFKDPRTARTKMYVNDAGRQEIERLVEEAGLSGLALSEPGPPLPRPRPVA